MISPSDGGSDAAEEPGRFECGVCWQVYDPAVGDPVWQIPPGTHFANLPPHWSCPNCSAEQHRFMRLDEPNVCHR